MSKVKNKLIRMKLDLQYQVPESVAEQYFENDNAFFKSIEESFWSWANKQGEVRIPIHADVDVTIGDIKEEES